MIEDLELKALFQAESEERLEHLEKGLKELEKDPSNQETIEGIFRDAHTIKGAARMLDIISIEKITHRLEDLLDGIRRKKYGLTPLAISNFYETLDAIRALVGEEIDGKPSSVNVDSILNLLNVEILSKFIENAAPSPPPSVPVPPATPPPIAASVAPPTAPVPASVTPPTASVSAPVPSSAQEKETEKQPSTENPAIPSQAIKLPEIPSVETDSKAKILKDDEAKILKRVATHSLSSPTIRIQTHQLNELMAKAGNLTVIKNRIVEVLKQLEELTSYLDKLSQMERLQALQRAGKRLRGATFENEDAYEEKYEAIFKFVLEKLTQIEAVSSEDFYTLGKNITSISDRIRMLGLVPLSNLFDLFPRMVSELADTCGKKIDFILEGGEITVDKIIIENMKDPIMHILRNAISHGIEPPEERLAQSKNEKGRIELKAYQTSNKIVFEIRDDGRGLDLDRIKQIALERKILTPQELETMTVSEIQLLIFMPGFSTATEITAISGRGVGMDVVRSNIEKLNGIIQIESQAKKGCQIYVQLPISLLTTHVMLVEVEKNIYAIPIDTIETCILITHDQLFTIEGRGVICIDDQPISVDFLADLLALSSKKELRNSTEKLYSIILKVTGKRFAVIVDEILEEQKVVVIPADFFFGKIRALAGTTILKMGKVCVVLNTYDLIKDLIKELKFNLHETNLKERTYLTSKKRVLLVDDSYSIRTIIKKLLESEGFEVITAEDGFDGLEKIKTIDKLNVIVSDIEMPKMDGISLTKNIRMIDRFFETPIILFTTVDDEAKKKQGMKAGANFYLLKTDYNHAQLIKTLRDLK